MERLIRSRQYQVLSGQDIGSVQDNDHFLSLLLTELTTLTKQMRESSVSKESLVDSLEVVYMIARLHGLDPESFDRARIQAQINLGRFEGHLLTSKEERINGEEHKEEEEEGREEKGRASRPRRPRARTADVAGSCVEASREVPET